MNTGNSVNYADCIIKGNFPPWIYRFVKQVGRGINHYKMIGSGDHILLGISGGKDSLALAFALSLRKKWLPINYDLSAVHIDWEEYPISEAEKTALFAFFDTLKIPYILKKARMQSPSFKKKFNCYLCSRNRKRILFNYAEELGISKIALGHNLDDIAETSLINLCFRGDFSTMLPLQNFFGGKIRIIRPLCEVREDMVKRAAEKMNMPVLRTLCPFAESNIRSRIKPILKELNHIDKLTREHIYNAHFKKQIEEMNDSG